MFQVDPVQMTATCQSFGFFFLVVVSLSGLGLWFFRSRSKSRDIEQNTSRLGNEAQFPQHNLQENKH